MNFVRVLTFNIILKNHLISYRIVDIFYLMTKESLYQILQIFYWIKKP